MQPLIISYYMDMLSHTKLWCYDERTFTHILLVNIRQFYATFSLSPFFSNSQTFIVIRNVLLFLFRSRRPHSTLSLLSVLLHVWWTLIKRLFSWSFSRRCENYLERGWCEWERLFEWGWKFSLFCLWEIEQENRENLSENFMMSFNCFLEK